jgi:NAD(P)H-dependent FMN reductase
MFYIPVILGCTRQSPKVAKFVVARMQRREQIETECLTSMNTISPLMEERLRFRDDPPPRLEEFAAKIQRADGIVIVTPE